LDATYRPTWKTLLAFAIIYFVWGSTYLAIRVGVLEVPPFLLAGIRFFIAGLMLFAWVLARGERLPSLRQWASISLLAFLSFGVDYGLVFWAEQKVPSGVTAIMMALVAAFMALAEIIFLRTQKLTLRLALALLVARPTWASTLTLASTALTKIGFGLRTMPSRSSFSFWTGPATSTTVPGRKPYFSARSFWIGGDMMCSMKRTAASRCAGSVVVTRTTWSA